MLDYFGVALLLAIFTVCAIAVIESYNGRRDRIEAERRTEVQRAAQRPAKHTSTT